jgi:hypothetical protein
VSKKSSDFIQLLHTQAEIVPAHFHNQAGIIGAALAQAKQTTLSTHS